jgi:hypothetical protein
LGELGRDPEPVWAKAKRLISTKVPARYDEAVSLLTELWKLARRDGRVS